MKNSGLILWGISMVFIFVLSILGHAFKSNVISYFSLFVVLGDYLYIFLADSGYGFYDTVYLSVFGFSIPELDAIAVVALAPLFVLLLLNSILRR